MEDTHRWSELIPPQTALTFAAMYDPSEGIITFSGGSLLDSSDSGYSSSSSPSKYSQDSYAPREAYDSQSQVLTIDRLAYALGATPNSAALALEQSGGIPFTFVCEAVDSGAESILLNSSSPEAWKPRPRAIRVSRSRPPERLYVVNGDPSSPVSEESEERKTISGEGGYEMHADWSHLRDIGSKLLSVAKTPFDGRMFHSRRSSSPESSHISGEDHGGDVDEGFFEDACLTGTSFYTAPLLVNMNLKSAFSVTTTSTSPFVHVSVPSVSLSGHCHPLDSLRVPTPSPEDGSDALDMPPHIHEANSETWRTPTLDAFEFLEGDCPNSPREFRRRLKKMRRYPPAPACPPFRSRSHPRSHSSHDATESSDVNEPASPEEVLARHDYNHVSSPCASEPRPRPGLRRQKSFTAKMRKSVVERLTKLVPSNLKEDGNDERWVWVEVTHKVTQHVFSVPLVV